MNNNLLAVITIASLVLFGFFVVKNNQKNTIELENITNVNELEKKGHMNEDKKKDIGNSKIIAKFNTSLGSFELELFDKQMPITTENFIKLAQSGFYNDTLFHRVMSGFMIQGGDPLTKDTNVSLYGTGGPGYTITDEFVEGLSNVRGTISMANTGRPNSGGSQFFINVTDNTFLDFNKEPLSSKHPVFGKVISGMDVVDEIVSVDTTDDRPVNPIKVNSIIIENRKI